MAGKTMTGPLALVKVNGQIVMKLKSIRVTEQITRGSVQSLGNLIKDEVPALMINCTLSASFYTITMKDPAINNSINRQVGSVQNFIDNILLNDTGVDIEIYKKIKNGTNPTTNLPIPGLELFATIQGAFANRESFDISEGQISGRDLDFDYLTPILY